MNERWGAFKYLDEEGEHDDEDVSSSSAKNHDSSGMGLGSDLIGVPCAPIEPIWEEEEGGGGVGDVVLDGAIQVHQLSLDVFKKKLVEHFDILWQRKGIKWLSWTGRPAPPGVFSHHSKKK